jgi:predicted secreted acid phosphatase
MRVRDSTVAVEWALAFLGCMRHLAARPCIVLDIDGTVLLNGSDGTTRCVLHFHSLVSACAQNGITVFCVTARPEDPGNRAYTMRQLEKCKITPVAKVYMRAPDAEYATYKYKARKNIAAHGFSVLLTVGDQWADISLTEAPDEIEDDKTYIGQMADDMQFGIKLPSEFA